MQGTNVTFDESYTTSCSKCRTGRTKPESDIMKHPICEWLVALNRLVPRLSLLRTPQNAAQYPTLGVEECADS